MLRRAAAAQQKGIAALNPTNIKHAFVTHLHSDHTIGYPDLIFTSWVIGRKVPLEVYGPPGIRAMTDHVLAAWADDIKIRNGPIERELPEHSADGYMKSIRRLVTRRRRPNGNGCAAHITRRRDSSANWRRERVLAF